MPGLAVGAFEDSCVRFLEAAVRCVPADGQGSLGLQQRHDDAELPAATLEGDSALVAPLAEQHVRCPKVRERLADVFTGGLTAEGITAGIWTCHSLTMLLPGMFRCRDGRMTTAARGCCTKVAFSPQGSALRWAAGRLVATICLGMEVSSLNFSGLTICSLRRYPSHREAAMPSVNTT